MHANKQPYAERGVMIENFPMDNKTYARPSFIWYAFSTIFDVLVTTSMLE